MLAYIWAEDIEHNIGIDGHLPWHLPADLKYFKKQTLNHPIIMGFNTFQSLPYILPSRKHIVLTHHHLKINGVCCFHSDKDLRQWIYNHKGLKSFVIGGASLFQLFKDDVDELYQTKIYHKFNGDVKMPLLDWNRFSLIKHNNYKISDVNKYMYDFNIYRRN